MGEYAELAILEDGADEFGPIDTVFDTYYGWIHHRYNNDYIWKQLNGREIDIREMGNFHLQNTINMLERAHHDYSDCLVLYNMKQELNRRT